MILSQAFLWRSSGGTESKHGHSVVPEPSHTVPIPQLWDVGDMAPNATSKRALELSPGPKSPSASHAQKHTKDDVIHSGLKTSSSLVPAGE